MERPSANITSILDTTLRSGSRVEVAGTLLSDLWVTTGEVEDSVELLLHEVPRGRVWRVMVFGPEATVVAGRFAQGECVFVIGTATADGKVVADHVAPG